MTGALLHSVTHITYLRCFYSTRISNMPAPRISKDANGNLQLVLGIPQKGFSFPKTSFWLCIYQKYNVNDIIIKMFDGLKKKNCLRGCYLKVVSKHGSYLDPQFIRVLKRGRWNFLMGKLNRKARIQPTKLRIWSSRRPVFHTFCAFHFVWQAWNVHCQGV
jgi:hypothetical protein